ncbi:MAG: type I-E CRISPR-associated protein Cas7/Cse4/CasC [Armatimonadetes bacterium]|nr:type I-E CRISPR-associated protein Cas7/Cse4/CasC [Armatimonadota bacterium]
MFIELHIIQSFAPSCLNRDDLGRHKECHFGGHLRARISSQCLKRAIRWHPAFTTRLGAPRGVRTRRLVDPLTHRLSSAGHNREAAYRVACALVEETVAQLGDDGKTRVLTYLGTDELDRLCTLALGNWQRLESLALCDTAARLEPPATTVATRHKEQSALSATVRELLSGFTPGSMAPDIALFGRMIAENAHLNVDAACQVAHALSTHRVTVDVDFFTAVDDLRAGGSSGAEMLGLADLCGACFYRYAVVSWEQLVENLGSSATLAVDVVEAFLRAAIMAVPRARQSSTAAYSLPSLILIVVRASDSPWSLVNAFETPVWVPEGDRQGVVARSITALDNHWGELVGMYGSEGICAVAACWLGSPTARHLKQYRHPGVEEVLAVVLSAVRAGGRTL